MNKPLNKNFQNSKKNFKANKFNEISNNQTEKNNEKFIPEVKNETKNQNRSKKSQEYLIVILLSYFLNWIIMFYKIDKVLYFFSISWILCFLFKKKINKDSLSEKFKVKKIKKENKEKFKDKKKKEKKKQIKQTHSIKLKQESEQMFFNNNNFDPKYFINVYGFNQEMKFILRVFKINEEGKKLRNKTFNLLKHIISNKWPLLNIELYGSFYHGLCLKDSDLNVSISQKNIDNSNNDQDLILALSEELKKTNFFDFFDIRNSILNCICVTTYIKVNIR